ncbi:MAG: lipoyl(octanoyl) transferase LipB [Tepidisphaeraceae bacterium]|jgi:lipoyl(octanoyl) transferase
MSIAARAERRGRPWIMRVVDLGRMAYRKAWAVQEDAHANVLTGDEEMLLIVEHPAVITLGRRGSAIENLISSQQRLEEAGIELVQSDRGGDITLHSPGQIVAYPIIRLVSHKLSVGGYVHRLESAVIEMLGELGISGFTDPKAVGVWVRHQRGSAKICAIGVRIKRGVSMHGLALNVDNDLGLFNHIVPCGLADKSVTSVAELLGDRAPGMEEVKSALVSCLARAFGKGD